MSVFNALNVSINMILWLSNARVKCVCCSWYQPRAFTLESARQLCSQGLSSLWGGKMRDPENEVERTRAKFDSAHVKMAIIPEET